MSSLALTVSSVFFFPLPSLSSSARVQHCHTAQATSTCPGPRISNRAWESKRTRAQRRIQQTKRNHKRVLSVHAWAGVHPRAPRAHAKWIHPRTAPTSINTANKHAGAEDNRRVPLESNRNQPHERNREDERGSWCVPVHAANGRWPPRARERKSARTVASPTTRRGGVQSAVLTRERVSVSPPLPRWRPPQM